MSNSSATFENESHEKTPRASLESRRIILARHGQTTWNLAQRFQGKTDTELTDEGRNQARALAERLSSWAVEVIYTSPLKRAVDTAQAIADAQNIPGLKPVILNDLCEIDFASWEGKSIPDLGEPYLKWRQDPFFNEPEGAESWEALKLRFGRAVDKILAGPESRIVIVSHGGVVRALYSLLVGINPHQAWDIECSNCSMSGVVIRGTHSENDVWTPKGKAILSFANDNLHIRGGEAGRHMPVW